MARVVVLIGAICGLFACVSPAFGQVTSGSLTKTQFNTNMSAAQWWLQVQAGDPSPTIPELGAGPRSSHTSTANVTWTNGSIYTLSIQKTNTLLSLSIDTTSVSYTMPAGLFVNEIDIGISANSYTANGSWNLSNGNLDASSGSGTSTPNIAGNGPTGFQGFKITGLPPNDNFSGSWALTIHEDPSVPPTGTQLDFNAVGVPEPSPTLGVIGLIVVAGLKRHRQRTA